ncbi:MAG TPA: transposase family protein [Nitrospiraceae bacterium]
MRITGYNRTYASHLLHNWGTERVKIVDGERVRVVLGIPRHKKQRKPRSRVYDRAVIEILEKIWAIADGLCGKRLKAFIHTALPSLERYREISFPDPALRTKLLSVSPATIDRLLAPTRKRFWDRARSRTKPGTLLKHHIPIRTFADWNETSPGFLEIDLVAHDGGSGYGDFLQTLDATDIATGWTEPRALRSKARIHVVNALEDIRRALPFPLLGIDSDNGAEFINDHLFRVCTALHITFTRSRPYRKNDSCFVEQKNYSIVRRAAGYYRYDTDKQLEMLTALYAQLRLYTNYFQPAMKLVSKTRQGSSVHKTYDEPQTPLERVLLLDSVSTQDKARLSQQFNDLNPAQLKRTIAHLQQQLFLSHTPLPQRPANGHELPVHHPWRKIKSKSAPARHTKTVSTSNKD